MKVRDSLFLMWRTSRGHEEEDGFYLYGVGANITKPVDACESILQTEIDCEYTWNSCLVDIGYQVKINNLSLIHI